MTPIQGIRDWTRAIIIIVATVLVVGNCAVPYTAGKEQPSSSHRAAQASDPGATTSTSSNPCETRAAWVQDVSRRDKPIDDALAAHLNTVFVLVPPITNQNGINDGLGNAEDFVYFIRHARSRGLSVHAWILNGYRASSTGETNFSKPVEQQQQVDWIISLMDTYGADLDGIHFDYIRLMDWTAIDAVKLNAITTTVQKANGALKAKYPGKLLTATVVSVNPNYADWTREAIPQWYRSWFAEYRGNWFEVAYPNFDSVPGHMKYGQDPISWIRNGYIDAIFPMQYMPDDATWQKHLDYWEKFVTFQQSSLAQVVPGIGWLDPEPDNPEFTHNAAAVVRQIKYARSIGASGTAIYHISAWSDVTNRFYDDSPLIQALTIDSVMNGYDAPYKTNVPTCLSISRK